MQFIRNPLIYSSKHNGCTIFDIIRLIESLESGILFDISNKFNISMKKVNGYYGKAFENYLSDCLTKICSKEENGRFISEKTLRELLNKDNKKISDGFIKYGDKGILLEFKSNLFKEEYKANSFQYNKAIKNRYSGACEQLISTIKSIYNSPNSIIDGCKTIFPVLVVKDSNLCSIVSQSIIADIFDEYKADMKWDTEIKRLIVITIDEFEVITGNKKINISKLLSEYDKSDIERKGNIFSYMCSKDCSFDFGNNKDNIDYVLKKIKEAKRLFKDVK